MGRSHDAQTDDVDRRARHHGDAQTEAVGDRADQRLRKAPDNVLNRQRQRKIRRRHREIVRDRRQEQSETLAYPHAEREQQGGSDQNQPGLAAAYGNRS